MGNLDLKTVTPNTAGNYVQSNTADDQIDLALTEKRSLSVVNNVDWTTGDAQDVSSNKYKALRTFYIEMTGAQAANRTFTVPNNKKPYWVKNACTGGFTTTFKNSSGTGVVLNNGDRKLLYCNGSDIEVLV